MKHLFLSVSLVLLCQAGFSQSKGTRDKVDSMNKSFDEKEKTDLDAAEQLANDALTLASQSGYERGEAEARANLGRVNIRRGNNKKAIEYLFAALKFFGTKKEFQNAEKYGITAGRLAGALYFERDFDRSLTYSRKAFDLARRDNNPILLGVSSRVRGEVFRDRGQFDSALYYFGIAAETFNRINHLTHVANLYIDIGLVHYYQGDYHQAIAFNKKFYELARKLNLQTDYSIGLHNIGEFNYLLKDYKQALLFLDSAQFYGEKFRQWTVLTDTYGVKAKVFRALRNPDSVAQYYEKVIAIKDSISSNTYKKELAALQTEMDVFRHEAENKILVNEKSIATLYRNLAIAGFIAIVFLLAFVLARQRLRVQQEVKRKLEAEVLERTAEVVQQKGIIEQVNLKLQLSLNRAKVDPHFIFNVLNSIQHLVLEKKPTEASDHLARLSRLTRYILEKSSLDEVTVREEVTMLEQYIRLEQLRLDNKFRYEIHCTLPDDTLLPAMLIQPYVENAIVHGLGPAAGDNLLLSLSLTEAEGALQVTVEDNGMGIRKGTVRKDHNSIGSTLGKERMEILSRLDHGDYTLTIQDRRDLSGQTGTRVTLTIPLRLKQTA